MPQHHNYDHYISSQIVGPGCRIYIIASVRFIKTSTHSIDSCLQKVEKRGLLVKRHKGIKYQTTQCLPPFSPEKNYCVSNKNKLEEKKASDLGFRCCIFISVCDIYVKQGYMGSSPEYWD